MSSVISMERPGQGVADAFVVTRSGTLDLRSAGELRETLLAAMSGGRPVALDATEVTSVDAGIVQVLLAAQRSADQSGRRFSVIAGPKSALPDALSRLGIAPLHR